jgi:hypothetical protein
VLETSPHLSFEIDPHRQQYLRMEPELTIKLANRRARFLEVPISYSGRTYSEGKKIGWVDGFAALRAIVRFSMLGCRIP